VTLGFFELLIIELGEGTTQVRLKILRRLVGDLDRVLENGLGDDFLVRKRWWLGGNEATEFRMDSLFDNDFKLTFKVFQPAFHEMHVLEHSPLASLACICELV